MFLRNFLTWLFEALYVYVYTLLKIPIFKFNVLSKNFNIIYIIKFTLI